MNKHQFIISIVKGNAAAIMAFALNKLLIPAEWYFSNVPSFVFCGILVVQIILIALILKSKSLNIYLVSCVTFMIVSALIGLIFINLDNKIFYLICGADAEMWAGDGFMLMTIYATNIVNNIIGIILSLIWTWLYTKRKRRTQ